MTEKMQNGRSNEYAYYPESRQSYLWYERRYQNPELARLREKALHDEASALKQAKDEGKSEGVAMVIEKMKASGMTEAQINAILSLN